MKKMGKLILGLTLLFGLSIALSSFTPPPPPDNNGVDVEVVKDEMWYLVTTCGLILRESTTTQYKDGVKHMRTTIYEIKDFCPGDVPDKATKYGVTKNYTMLYTPSGTVIVKQIINVKK